MFEPRCPKCGRKGTPTGYSLPYPAWRCVYCIRESQRAKEQQSLEIEVRILRDKVQRLEKETE